MLWKGFRWILGGTAISLIAAGVFISGLLWMTPDVDPLIENDPKSTAFIDRTIASGVPVSWSPVPYDSIATDLKLAVLLSEDSGFFQHHGFDTFEIRTALMEALDGKRLRGASTISQQLAKNLWLSQDRTLSRKLNEAALTWKLEHNLSKRRILELYLNTAMFGPGIFGVEAACQRYFSVSASDVTTEQAARLAASLPAPSFFFPGSQSPRAERQYQRILQRMQRQQWLRNFL